MHRESTEEERMKPIVRSYLNHRTTKVLRYCVFFAVTKIRKISFGGRTKDSTAPSSIIKKMTKKCFRGNKQASRNPGQSALGTAVFILGNGECLPGRKQAAGTSAYWDKPPTICHFPLTLIFDKLPSCNRLSQKWAGSISLKEFDSITQHSIYPMVGNHRPLRSLAESKFLQATCKRKRLIVLLPQPRFIWFFSRMAEQSEVTKKWFLAHDIQKSRNFAAQSRISTHHTAYCQRSLFRLQPQFKDTFLVNNHKWFLGDTSNRSLLGASSSFYDTSLLKCMLLLK